jgi:hypothetical protein
MNSVTADGRARGVRAVRPMCTGTLCGSGLSTAGAGAESGIATGAGNCARFGVSAGRCTKTSAPAVVRTMSAAAIAATFQLNHDGVLSIAAVAPI